MRLLVNAVGIVKGGGQRHLAPFLTALSAARPSWRVTVCVDERKADGLAVPGTVDVAQVEIRNGPARLRWDAFGVSGHAERLGASCIVNMGNAGPWAPPVPSIVYQRNSLYFDPAWITQVGYRTRWEAQARRALAFRAASASAAVVAPSLAMAGFLRSWPAWQNDWLAVSIPHAVDSARFAYCPRPLPLDRPFNLTAISHSAPHKGLDTVVRAVADLRLRGFDAACRFTLPRHGNIGIFQRYVDDLVALADRLRLGDHMQLIAPRADVEGVYADSSVVVSASLTESFGFPVIEAMASGAPIVASAIPASIELLGANGTYFAPGNHRGLVGAVLSLGSASPDAQGKVLAAARSKAETRTWLANAEALAILVEDVVSRR